jgi:hypothetical protein
MESRKLTRSVAVLAAATLVLGAFVAAPAEAKKKKKKTPPPCAAYVPGEQGAEAETVVVTDAATEEAPVEVALTAGPGAGAAGPYDETTSVFQNIQVDTAGSEAGLYVRFEFAANHDYDLYLNFADGSNAATSGDFNPAAGHDLGSGSPDGAWEAGSNYEMVKGIGTPDCEGYTAEAVSFLTTGGATTMKIWLGEIVAYPGG